VLTHDQSAAVDRRAVRTVLDAWDLLRIHPRRQSQRAKNTEQKLKCVTSARGAGRLALAEPAVGAPLSGAQLDQPTHVAAAVAQQSQEADSST